MNGESMLSLDHLTIVAPTLKDGVEHVRACLGIEMPYGGRHPEMGTHNHVLRLGDEAYLEVIAVDPGGLVPASPRWFGLGDPKAVRSHWTAGLRLRGWVARTNDLDAVLAVHGPVLGGAIRVSRDGNHSRISMPRDGSLPLGGALPSVIERGGREPPAQRMLDLGARLTGFELEHPEPSEVEAWYRRLGVAGHPRVRKGPAIRYRASIDTPGGARTLG